MVALSTNVAKRQDRFGTTTFAELSDYESAFGEAEVQLTAIGSGAFKARLTWWCLRHMHILRGYEEVPRIAYVSLPPSRVFVSFSTGDLPLIWNGIELQSGDIVFHSRGERMYQRTTGESRWGLISLPAAQLAFYSNSLIGRKIAAPPIGRVLRPQRIFAERLLRLHAKACRLAETKANSTAHPDVARALEQELLHALVDCLTVDDAGRNWISREHHTNIMVRLEDAVAVHSGGPLGISKLCAAIGVPERTLRVCCTELLGMSPTRYLLMRRLNSVRAALQHADPTTASVAEIARRYHFSELGRFAVTYRRIFGEVPSATLSRAC
jgi:AraC-like DNA-binding protein